MPSVGFIEKARAPKIMSIGFPFTDNRAARPHRCPPQNSRAHCRSRQCLDRATDRHRQPLARTVPRELMFKAYARLMATVWRAAPEGVDHRIAGAARLRRFRAIAAILLRA